MIAFLTARNEEYSQIAGFEAGADDYINKPVKPRVLVSRMAALMKRGRVLEPDKKERINIGGIRIDHEHYVVTKDGHEINLPKKEFELLTLFASKPFSIL